MIDLSDNAILMIEPRGQRSEEPIIDDLTRAAVAMLRKTERGPTYRGFHQCTCGASSALYFDALVPDLSTATLLRVQRFLTNSLAVHYVAFHRDELPPSEVRKL